MAPNAASSPLLELVAIVRNPRAKRLSLRVEARTGKVVLVLPPRGSLKAAHTFINQHEGWIRAQHAKQGQTATTPLEPLASFTLFGEAVVMQHHRQQRGALWQAGSLTVGGDIEFFARRVQAAIMARMEKDFYEKMQPLLKQINHTKPVKLVVKDVSSRWGSCSSLSGICLNWRLAFTPPEVAHYVLVHEVAHLLHMNHSPAFWRLVDTLLAEPHQPFRAWLRQHGGAIMRIGQA